MRYKILWTLSANGYHALFLGMKVYDTYDAAKFDMRLTDPATYKIVGWNTKTGEITINLISGI